MEIFREFTFDAAHRLDHLPEGHKCARVHGHTSRLTLFVNGALDPVSGKHAYDKWREVLPFARHHLLPDVGHYPHIEAPERVAAKALEWLDG